MASITLAGTLLDPNGDLAVGDQIRFTHNSTTGQTVRGAVSVVTINPAGTYTLPLQFGLVLVEYKDVRNVDFKNLGVATVNSSNTATSIPELLNALVPVSSAELIEFQAILSDSVAARNAAQASAATLDKRVITFPTLSVAISETDTALIFNGAFIKTSNYRAGVVGGGANYRITDSYVGTPDGDFDVYVGGGTALVAVLQYGSELDLMTGGFNPSSKTDWSDFFDVAMIKSKIIYSKFISGDVVISRPIDISGDVNINLNLCKLEKSPGYTSNADNTIINFTGNNSNVSGVDGSDIVSSNEKLIGFQSNANNCTEENCMAPFGRLILNQGVANTNVSKSLNRLVSQYGDTSKSKSSKKINLTVVTTTVGGSGDLRRIRYIPSLMRITRIKVTDLGGSPNYAFTLSDNQSAVFSKALGGSNLDAVTDIDYINDGMADTLDIKITCSKAIGTVHEVEITYEEYQRCNSQVAWFYSSANDFLKPHRSNATVLKDGIRAIEYRSHISGGGLNVTNAIPDRLEDTFYNWPHVTVPTPAGTRDTSETTELKFYLNYSAAQALRDGATHLRFRFHSTPEIKCTVINGWLSQAYDNAPTAHFSTLGFQPDIELDLPAAGVDDNDSEVILIPLDIKAMQQGALQNQQYDFNYFYITFFQNLPGHFAIEWGDNWSFDIDFIRDPNLS